MEKKKEEGEISAEEAVGAIAVGAAIAATGYLLLKFISSLFDKKTDVTDVWRCGNCGFILRKRYDKCPKCGVKIKWG